MLVAFGAPNPMHDHALQALMAARSMVHEVQRLNSELEGAGYPTIAVGIGLDTGDVIAGHVGSEKRLEFTLIGVAVNNAAYLSKIRPAKVLMSEATRFHVPEGMRITPSEPMLLKGAHDPQAIYELEAN
jgi:adenylate cyclase